ncbi:carboxylate-amine ligase [Nakamurella deserti]|uniref:carboxylate-amine ligase n=1 Tax=Nakamurella deserti TaxID=2164074 RepID=UPI000DBE5874|nr:glutamate--cysteine ligase [Nakamurella deserti]
MRTVGIEEELLVVSSDTMRPLPVGDRVVADARAWPDQFEPEFKKEQVELGSAPSTSIAAIGDEVHRLRTEMSAAARRHGADVVAIASSPFKVRPTISDGARYAEMTQKFGLLARQQLTCGQHVHVSVASPEEGVAVLDRIRPWLAVLTAISGNSPFWHGELTGYASYRSIMWGLWPTAGPTETFGDLDGYRRAMDERLASGAAMDVGMMYFDARLSSHYPTVEIRVPDVCTDIADALLIAALARGLVDTAAAEWRDGRDPAPVSVGLLRAAAWRAARWGMADDLVDVVATTAVPAHRQLAALVDHIAPALAANGDTARVETAVRRLRRTGTGATFQLRSYAQRSDLADVVRDAAARTVGGSSDA